MPLACAERQEKREPERLPLLSPGCHSGARQEALTAPRPASNPAAQVGGAATARPTRERHPSYLSCTAQPPGHSCMTNAHAFSPGGRNPHLENTCRGTWEEVASIDEPRKTRDGRAHAPWPPQLARAGNRSSAVTPRYPRASASDRQLTALTRPCAASLKPARNGQGGPRSRRRGLDSPHAPRGPLRRNVLLLPSLLNASCARLNR